MEVENDSQSMFYTPLNAFFNAAESAFNKASVVFLNYFIVDGKSYMIESQRRNIGDIGFCYKVVEMLFCKISAGRLGEPAA